MSEPAQRNPGDRELVERIAETSLRMMAGAVPRDVVARLQSRLLASPDDYPWQEVVDAVLAEPVDDSEMVNRGLVAQRNWVLRDGAGETQASPRRRGKSLETRAKTAVAAVIVKGGFFVVYTAAVIAVLVLLKHRFPGCDVYRILEWLGGLFPAVFGG